MKKFKQYRGLFLIIIGTLVLCMTRIDALSYHNWLLLLGLFCILAGIYYHIRTIKHQSQY